MTKRPTKQKTDPIFALIEKHKDATAEHIAAGHAIAPMRRTDDGYRTAELRHERSWKNLRALQVELLKATPTTMQGCLALLRHVSTPQAEEAFGGGYDNTPLGDISASYANMGKDSRLIKIAHAFLPRIADRIEKLT
jgi:hypothetical protein